jgi:lauroyl/myristoyl acyltransferase
LRTTPKRVLIIVYDEQQATQIIDQDFQQIVRKYPERWLQIYHARLG